MRVLVTAFLFLAVCAAASGAQWVTETGGELRFGNGRVELRFDRQSGRWLALYGAASPQPVLSEGGRQPSVMLVTDGKTVVQGSAKSVVDTRPIGAGLTLSGWREERIGAAVWLALDTVEGDWGIEQRYGLEPEGDTVQRRVRLAWRGSRETLLRRVEFRTPALTDLKDAILEAPGYPGVLHQPLLDLPSGRWRLLGGQVAGSRPGLLVVSRPGSNLLVWGYDEVIPSQMHTQRSDWGVWFAQDLLASTRVREGQRIDVGTQYLCLRPGSLPQVLLGFREFWKQVSLGRRGGTPAWANTARIYEVHIGAKGFGGGVVHEPYPTIEALIEDLPRIAGLGFNVVLLMPHFPWPNYRVVDYANIDLHYAPERDLRRMVDRAHALGMKVLLDVVMHGVIADKVLPFAPWDRHPWLAEHPEWFSQTEDGAVAKTYTWSFDHASPSFQDFMVRTYADYVRRLNVDGFRADAITWNFFPNWAPGLGRPGYASFHAAKPMFDRIRDAARKVKPDVVFYTETQGPLFNTCFDLTYSYDEHWLYEALLPLRSTRGYSGLAPAIPRKMNARQAGEWLTLRRLALPPDVRRVHHADSHDSHEWGGLHMFKKEAFGVEAARLLFAFSAFLDGGVMNYVGAEAGSEDFYRRVLALRGSVPALAGDSLCDYLAIESTSDRVLAPLRRRGKEWALPVLSFSAEPVETNLSLAALGLDARANYEFTEAFTQTRRKGKGADFLRFAVTLPPYGVQLWTASRR